MSEEKTVLVTNPLLPDLKEFESCLEKIWESKWLTNNGSYHKELEKALCEYLKVENLSLFTNGTLPLITGLQALGIREGEVITTPYSFVATTHSIWWNGLKPVFVDVDPATGNINPDKIEEAITPNTKAIMPVHVYGNPCDVERIDAIAKKYNLKVIYDAAHAFGVEINGKSVLEYGDISTLSFHATKVYNTVEGGALVCQTAEMKKYIDQLKNFGFTGEITVAAPGINSKMDEIRSAYGLLNLKKVDAAIEDRKKIVNQYRDSLKNVKGISFFPDMKGVRHNYAYFPVFVNEKEYGMNRDSLYELMKTHNLFGRRYFYPLITEFEPYKDYESARAENLPVAKRMAEEVICLPIYAGLESADVERVIECIREKK